MAANRRLCRAEVEDSRCRDARWVRGGSLNDAYSGSLPDANMDSHSVQTFLFAKLVINCALVFMKYVPEERKDKDSSVRSIGLAVCADASD